MNITFRSIFLFFILTVILIDCGESKKIEEFEVKFFVKNETQQTCKIIDHSKPELRLVTNYCNKNQKIIKFEDDSAPILLSFVCESKSDCTFKCSNYQDCYRNCELDNSVEPYKIIEKECIQAEKSESLYTVKKITDFKCNGISKDDKNVCNARGSCEATDLCFCYEPDLYDGTFCESWKCNGIDRTNPLVCNNHGTCLENHLCNCSTNWDGLFCTNPICNNKKNGCGSFGVCLDTHKCQCFLGIKGNSCEDLSIVIIIGSVTLSSFGLAFVLGCILCLVFSCCICNIKKKKEEYRRLKLEFPELEIISEENPYTAPKPKLFGIN